MKAVIRHNLQSTDVEHLCHTQTRGYTYDQVNECIITGVLLQSHTHFKVTPKVGAKYAQELHLYWMISHFTSSFTLSACRDEGGPVHQEEMFLQPEPNVKVARLVSFNYSLPFPHNAHGKMFKSLV